jgi:putative transposase
MPRKAIRLSPEAYESGSVFSVTIATYYRSRWFDDADVAATGLACLREAAQRYDARVYAYCFMPDHVHLLAQTPPGTNFASFVDRFKQTSGIALRGCLETRSSIWQPRFFDHGLRSDEGLQATADYILNNPVRAGIVVEASEYPFTGSFEWTNVFARSAVTTEAYATELQGGVSPS